MSVKKIFTTEEVETLRANPYTASVTPTIIRFTLEFKKEFWRLSAEGCTGNQAFRKLGYRRLFEGGKSTRIVMSYSEDVSAAASTEGTEEHAAVMEGLGRGGDRAQERRVVGAGEHPHVAQAVLHFLARVEGDA